MSPGPVWICNRFTSLPEPSHIQTAVRVRAHVCERQGSASQCVQIGPGSVCVCVSAQVRGERRTRIRRSPPSGAHARLFSCLYHGRQQRSRGELEAVVTLCARWDLGVLTLSVFFLLFFFLINGYAVGGERLL